MKNRQNYLVTYFYQPIFAPSGNYGYSFETNVEDFIARVNKHEDGSYIVVNVLPVSGEFKDDYDGWLKGQ